MCKRTLAGCKRQVVCMEDPGLLRRKGEVQTFLHSLEEEAYLQKVLSYTVSWRIRIFNCIEEVPRIFFL
jgi:hypothetical protein